MENYINLGKIGEGTYGIVQKCRHKEKGHIVAIKKFKESDEDEQVRKTALREIRMLKELKHNNVVRLIEVFRRKGKLYLVFEYLESTILNKLDQHPYGLPRDLAIKYLYQTLKAVQYCHSQDIIHRDIKPENLLVSKNGVLKLCDFGFGRALEGHGAQYTDYVSTRWYRAPELLVGDTKYGKAVDIWAIGCLAAEMFNGLPLFPGDSDIDQLYLIVRCLGKLPEPQVNAFQKNPYYQKVHVPVIDKSQMETLDMRFRDSLPKDMIDFIKLCLNVDPAKRASCDQLLQSPLFEGMEVWNNTELQEMIKRDSQRVAAVSTLSGQNNNSKRRTKREKNVAERKRGKESRCVDDMDVKMVKKPALSFTRPRSGPASSNAVRSTVAVTESPKAVNLDVVGVDIGSVVDQSSSGGMVENTNKGTLPNIWYSPGQRSPTTQVSVSPRDDVYIPPINIVSMESQTSGIAQQQQQQQQLQLPTLSDQQLKSRVKIGKPSFAKKPRDGYNSRNTTPQLYEDNLLSGASRKQTPFYATGPGLADLRLTIRSSQLHTRFKPDKRLALK